MRKLKHYAAALIFTLALIGTSPAKAVDWEPFFLSSMYGTGVGALLGLTALAISDQPGQNLAYIARGASMGLYVGMGIGVYMTHELAEKSNKRMHQYPSVSVVPQRTKNGYETLYQAQYIFAF